MSCEVAPELAAACIFVGAGLSAEPFVRGRPGSRRKSISRATEQSIKMLWATRVAFGGPGSSSSMTATSAASGIEALGALGG